MSAIIALVLVTDHPRQKRRRAALPDQVCDESADEAHHEDGCGCHGHEVNGPRVVAFADKVEVPRAAFVSI